MPPIMPPMTSGFQRTTSDNSGRKIAANVDFKGFDGISRMVWEVLMVPKAGLEHRNYPYDLKRLKLNIVG